MKPIQIILALALGFVSGACQKKSSSNSDSEYAFGGGDKPSNVIYKDQALQGTVLGQKWTVGSAFLRASTSSASEVVLEIYGESVSNGCQAPTWNQAKGSLILPSTVALGDFDVSIMSGAPLVFVSRTAGMINQIADSGTLRLAEKSAGKFTAFLKTYTNDSENGSTDLDGRFEIRDCREMASFDDWKVLAGGYDLIEFDGRAVKPSYFSAAMDSSTVRDADSNKPLRMFELPLVYFVGENSSGSLTMGPIEGKGSTQVQPLSDGQKISYQLNAPVIYSGVRVTLLMDLKIVNRSGRVEIDYVVEVPGHLKRESHRLVLRKYQ